MTLRPRTPTRSRGSRLRRFFEGEERQQLLVTAMFIVLIVLVVVILVGAVALAWYNDNLRPLARVGAVEIRPQIVRDMVGVQSWRIERDLNRITQAQIEGEIDAETAATRVEALNQRAQQLGASAIDDVIDAVFLAQLAAERGIIVSDADVDEALADDVSGVERRRVLAIFVEPQAADDETEGTTGAERRAALERAQQAFAALEAGEPWADVARQYSTDPSAQNGGDYGIVSEAAAVDQSWANALFALPEGGTTEIIRGVDGTYRIGRVEEIVSAGEEPGARESLFETVAEPAYREIVRFEVAAERLREQVVDEALAEVPEQARVSVIYIEGLPSGDPEDEGGEVHYSEIVHAPGDDLIDSPDLPADDPAWAAAETEAQATIEELRAITDADELAQRFAEIAEEESDSPTGEDGGDAGFATRGIPPSAVADALFDTEHEEGELIGPVRGDAAWYVLRFHERRGSPDERLQAGQDALAEPGADFAAIAREHSDGPEAEDGGEFGWVTRDSLIEELRDAVFDLEPDGVSDPIELGDGRYIIKVHEKGPRPLDPDQVPTVRVSAFENWYTERREEAEDNGTIVRADDDGSEDDLDPGFDQP